MNRLFASMVLTGWSLVAVATAVVGETILDDPFDNAVAADNADQIGFWTLKSGPAEAFTEAEGRLTVEATGKEYANRHLLSPLMPALDFTRHPLVLEVAGLEIGGTDGSGQTTQIFRVSLLPTSDTEYRVATGLSISMTRDGRVRLGYKIDTPDKDPDSVNTLIDRTFSAVPTGFLLRLDPEGYALTLRMPESHDRPEIQMQGRFVDRGPGFSEEAWPADTGATLVLQAQKARGSNDDATLVTLDRVVVTRPVE